MKHKKHKEYDTPDFREIERRILINYDDCIVDTLTSPLVNEKIANQILDFLKKQRPETQAVIRKLLETNGNQSGAARELDVSQQSISKKIKRLEPFRKMLEKAGWKRRPNAEYDRYVKGFMTETITNPKMKKGCTQVVYQSRGTNPEDKRLLRVPEGWWYQNYKIKEICDEIECENKWEKEKGCG